MKLEVKEKFYDKVEGVYIEKEKDGKPNIIEREEERAKVMIAAGVAVEVNEEPKEEQKEEIPEDAKPKRGRKTSKAE